MTINLLDKENGMTDKKIVLKIRKNGSDMIRIIKGELLKDISFDNNLLREVSHDEFDAIIKILSKQSGKEFCCSFDENDIRVWIVPRRYKRLSNKKVVLYVNDYELPMSKLELERRNKIELKIKRDRKRRSDRKAKVALERKIKERDEEELRSVFFDAFQDETKMSIIDNEIMLSTLDNDIDEY